MILIAMLVSVYIIIIISFNSLFIPSGKSLSQRLHYVFVHIITRSILTSHDNELNSHETVTGPRWQPWELSHPSPCQEFPTQFPRSYYARYFSLAHTGRARLPKSRESEIAVESLLVPLKRCTGRGSTGFKVSSISPRG